MRAMRIALLAGGPLFPTFAVKDLRRHCSSSREVLGGPDAAAPSEHADGHTADAKPWPNELLSLVVLGDCLVRPVKVWTRHSGQGM
jgi:hypothetical protein